MIRLLVLVCLLLAGNASADTGGSMGGGSVSAIRIAVDGRARAFVQRELAAIAESSNTGSSHGRHKMMQAVVFRLRMLREAWIYGGAVNQPMRYAKEAKQAFDKLVDDARTKFREELVCNADGKTTTRQASDYSPRPDEGHGVVLVSIFIAAKEELFTVKKIERGDQLREALGAMNELSADDIVAVEVIWQPAADEDRLSSIELEAKYPPPELVRLHGAVGGKSWCDHCFAPYPAELVSCPNCGAPALGRAAAA